MTSGRTPLRIIAVQVPVLAVIGLLGLRLAWPVPPLGAALLFLVALWLVAVLWMLLRYDLRRRLRRLGPRRPTTLVTGWDVQQAQRDRLSALLRDKR